MRRLVAKLINRERPVEQESSAFAVETSGDAPLENSLPTDGMSVSTCRVTREDKERSRYHEQGRFLARQEDWADLGDLIYKLDVGRVLTQGGTPAAELICGGARSDIVALARDYVTQGEPHKTADALAELEQIAADHSEEYGVALVVATAHIDIGWLWRGEGWRQDIPATRYAAFVHHFQRANDILARFSPAELDAPYLASVRCSLLTVQILPTKQVADAYEGLIDLDPECPGYMRALGNHMLPRWFGDFEALELEARRTAARVSTKWGAGGYTWTYMDALAVDPMALSHVDPDYFLDGIRDILDRRSDQHSINMMAAYTGITMATPAQLPADAIANRKQIRSAFSWIVTDHLTELHPLIWANATTFCTGETTQSLVDMLEAGQVRALNTLNRHFGSSIQDGDLIHFPGTRPSVTG